MTTTNRYTRHGIDVCEDIPPDGFVVIDEYRPCSSVTPWDCYGIRHQQQYAHALRAAGIEPELLRTRETKLAPMGSGPGGYVRFGDDMLPGVYRIAVSREQVGKACAVISAHKQAVTDWLDNKAPMPAACRY